MPIPGFLIGSVLYLCHPQPGKEIDQNLICTMLWLGYPLAFACSLWAYKPVSFHLQPFSLFAKCTWVGASLSFWFLLLTLQPFLEFKATLPWYPTTCRACACSFSTEAGPVPLIISFYLSSSGDHCFSNTEFQCFLDSLAALP